MKIPIPYAKDRKSIRSQFSYSHLNLWVAIAIGVIYWLVNQRFDGPAYQQDEIGYLINAAFLAGFIVDGYSSYHAGYSAFLAPIFLFLSEPHSIWKGVQVINAIFWSGSFFLLDVFMRKTAPSLEPSRRLLIIFLCAIYPPWIVIAGYSFSQSIFIFFYLGATVALFSWRVERPFSLLPHSILVGFLFWIHPTAVGIIFSSTIVILLVCWINKRYQSLLIYLAVVVGMLIIYKMGIQAWMMREMTPEGYDARTHYPSIFWLISSASKLSFWGDFILVIFGQFAYLSISTFGVVIIGVINMVKITRFKLLDVAQDLGLKESRLAFLAIFILSSTLCVMMITAISFASQAHGPGSVDEWFYGRYVEGVVLPLIVMGLASWRTQAYKTGLGVMLGIILIGALIQVYAAEGAYLNLVNIQGFWPQSLAPQLSILLWFVIAVSTCISFFRVSFLVPIVALLLITTKSHLQWHENILTEYSRPSAMIDYIRKNVAKGSCVGFDPKLPLDASIQMAERIRLYSFYLFDYGYKRMNLSQWQQYCDGPLFTYDVNALAQSSDMNIVGVEPNTGLRLVLKGEKARFDQESGGSKYGPVIWGNSESFSCLEREACIFRSAFELSRQSQVGILDHNFLATDGRSGFLFFGPYAQLTNGSYVVKIQGNFQNLSGAVLDVVSHEGKLSHLSQSLSKANVQDNRTIELQFLLKNSVKDLEVRLQVDQQSQMSISSLKITPVK